MSNGIASLRNRFNATAFAGVAAVTLAIVAATWRVPGPGPVAGGGSGRGHVVDRSGVLRALTRNESTALDRERRGVHTVESESSALGCLHHAPVGK